MIGFPSTGKAGVVATGVFALILWFMAFHAAAQDFELYVVDVGPDRGPPWQVLKYDMNGNNPEVFVGSGLNRPQDILFLEDQGVALVSSLGSNRITRHDASTGAFIDNFATGIGQPTRIKIGADKLLYVLQWAGNGRVWRYDLDGNFVDEFTTVGVSNSIGMDWDSEGNLYVASFDARHVRKFDTNGVNQGLFVTTNLVGPTNIWFEDSGDLLVMDWSGRAIKRYNANGVFLSTFVTGLSEPEGIEFLDNGNFLIGNGGTSSVREYDASGRFVQDRVAVGAGGLAKPNAVRIRPLGVPFAINAGLTGAWFNPATAGQGLLVEVIPSRQEVFLAWFTYAEPDAGGKVGVPEHRWLTAQGSYADATAELTLSSTRDGVFDRGDAVSTVPVGSATLSFSDCEAARFNYALDDGPSGGFDLSRIAPDVLCSSLTEAIR
ncbi:MAG: NHL repeat-containing protein [Xanthomonadales bacterium]|nr:NHL repeat-containing protein [Xanthomonadales bacterium]